MNKKKKMVIIALVILVILALLIGGYKLMNSRTYQLFGDLTYRVDTQEKVVALTFDDGPTANVEKILSLLNQYDAKATFFLIGSELENHMQLGKDIVKAGHQIGNHTYAHKRMIFKSFSFIKREIEMTNDLIREVGYKGEIDFRPPNGKKLVNLPYYLKKQGIETITWDLEPDTYYSAVFDKVDYVNNNVKPGSIILLHPMHDNTENGLKTIEGILKSLSERGYKFITVNELKNM
ncbi:polysaccharide deacetylase family protein [Clostridium formicaceticum]|uniref:Peptidoglycan-N-acetylglucosamine deacetylase n=1 Tax=Clostridium formicaceticum TaxID=1497 RepID=A0AAC9RKM4_9CLOT|nr:polysaccharide deacetylase family protein [Clostridium formicaceticum]AOY74622.1 polysaccharide deacetylase [Clostridium formicaceticum]ARE88986.1 Peptidoglycan-N-acetylglucosamine deacetylase [Clostridium formicaceticum]